MGLRIAIAATRALESLLFEVESADVGTFLSMSAALVLVGLLASYLPARHASSVDPIESLRADRGRWPRRGRSITYRPRPVPRLRRTQDSEPDDRLRILERPRETCITTCISAGPRWLAFTSAESVKTPDFSAHERR